MGRRQQKRRETHQRISAAAMRLFRTHGYQETTVDMIAAEAEVSPRTFFRYFDSKDGVLGEVGRTVVDQAIDRLGPDPSFVEMTEALAAVLETEIQDADYALGLRLMRDSEQVLERMPIWRRRYAEHLAQGLATARGLEQPDYALRSRAHAAIHCIAVVIDEWAHNRPDEHPLVLAREALAALGLTTD